jgi:hypothetical protein
MLRSSAPGPHGLGLLSMERFFLHTPHWILHEDGLGLCEPGINNLEVRGTCIARINGSSVGLWADPIATNRVGADGLLFEARLEDGTEVRVSAGVLGEPMELTYRRGEQRSRFRLMVSAVRL